MITNVYIDGFNLYYGSLKGTHYRWLNLDALARSLLPAHQIHRIRYFSARVTTIHGDGDGFQPQRQAVYFRALETLAHLTIHHGHYLSHEVTMPLAHPTPNARFAQVIKREEKGSDVNLATELLIDAFTQDFEQAIVISNDSDLASPIEAVAHRLRLPVGVVFPCSRGNRQPSMKLRSVATFVREIRERTLARCQFPTTLQDAHGSFSCPSTWLPSR